MASDIEAQQRPQYLEQKEFDSNQICCCIAFQNLRHDA